LMKFGWIERQENRVRSVGLTRNAPAREGEKG